MNLWPGKEEIISSGNTKTIFCVRPATPNIGNDLIYLSLTDLIYRKFGSDISLVNVPALANHGFGGFTAAQIYDMNRLADGVILGGGNLFENGQVDIDSTALENLRAPLMVMGVSHGRIADANGGLVERTDQMSAKLIAQLAGKATSMLVRDDASADILAHQGIKVAVGGCPSLFMSPNFEEKTDGRILLSIRHPDRMSVPPSHQWRVAQDVGDLIQSLRCDFGNSVYLLCHDYKDLAFAAAFPGTPMLYYQDVNMYVAALRRCRLNISYRLHAFLPCLSFGTPSVHISYDERGQAMLKTIGMEDWNIDMLTTSNLSAAVADRARNLDQFEDLRLKSVSIVSRLAAVTNSALDKFQEAVSVRSRERAGL